ncbi:uncharacterized protein LOC143024611 [Oratosquilla oratoria]|uniref:uncharacterized protein LOC143024611 n=1 Tax=Oratosquilla oratoria TaxID=337810 RepID=UPI003F77429B
MIQTMNFARYGQKIYLKDQQGRRFFVIRSESGCGYTRKPKNRTLLAEVNRMSTAIILHVHNMSSCIVALEKAFVFDEAYKHLREVTETYFLSVYDSEINQLCLDEARNLTNQILHGNRRVDFTENFPLASFSTEENYYLFELSTWDESFYIIFAKNCSNVKRSQAHYLITGIHCNDELDWNFFCRSDIYLSWQLKLSRHIDFTSLCSSTSSQVDAMIKDLEKLPGNWVWTYVDHLCGSEIWNICKDVYNNKELGKLLGSQWSLASQYVDYFSMTCINYRITENPVVLFLNKKVKCHNRTEEDQKFILGTFDPKDKNYELTRPKTIQTNMNNRDWVSEITISSIPNKCPLFSWESNDKQFLIDILTGSIFENDTACMEHICTGSLQSSCIYERCSPIRFGPLEKSLYTISCFKYLPGSLWWDINEGFMFNRTTINWFWAIESYNYLIVYDNPEEKVVSLDWDYLSKKAMVWEAFLVSITVFVTSSLIFGNFLVIFVMVTGGHRGEISGILRNSLAVSDFLTGLFPCSLAVSDAVCLMTGRLTLYDLDAKSVLSSFERLVSDVLPPGLTELKFERFGYPAFCSLVFAVSSTSSLLTHFSLAIERYRAVSAAAVRGTVFNTPKKKAVAVMVPWLTAIAFAVICGSGNGSFLIGYLDPITKLTLWLPTSGTLVVSTVFFWLQFVAVAIFILATLIGTLLSVKTFTEERKREMKESQAYYEPSEEEVIQNKTILRRGRTTLLLTATLLGGSVLPMAASSFWQFPRYLPIFHYLMWWLFIAGMSCNWIVYNMRSKLFYSDMAESLLLLKAILPARMIRILENRVTDPRHPPPISEEDQIDLYRCVFRTTEDEKSTSKKRKEERTGDEDLEEVSNGSLNDRKDRGNTNVRSKSVKEPTQETPGVDNLNFLNNDSAIIEKGNIEFQEKESVVRSESLTTVEKGNGENDCQHLQDKKEA